MNLGDISTALPPPYKFRTYEKAREYARRLELEGWLWTITEIPGDGIISPHPSPRAAYDYFVVVASTRGFVRNPEVGEGEEV